MTTRTPLQGKVDFTLMYAAHDAFLRDLGRLAAAARTGSLAEPAVRTGWETFERQLRIHHTAEDAAVWPLLRQRVSHPGDLAVLDAMEAEHARIDPLLDRIAASLPALPAVSAVSGAGLAGAIEELSLALAAHMEHEENEALPLVETFLGTEGWAGFARQMRKTQGLSGAAVFFPWVLDGTPATTRTQVLGLLPAPARLLYRAVWAPRYARVPRWDGVSR
ncbi:MAG: Hemerythrin cation binding domain protein [Actinomycetia bacterium]|jgi:iron-sulfur cluster repair protein YtfE (RIC family)|nr:Hemerythrin cation binding domain protein [Actinomycetes bacterium]